VKKSLACGIILLATSSAVNAADLSRQAVTAIMAPPSFTWTGFYVGGNLGYMYGFGNTVTTGTAAFQTLVAPGIVPGRLGANRDGFLGGLQAGYNFQYGAAVLGAEADLQLTDLRRRASFTGAAVLGTQLTTSSRADLRYLGTLRARIGFTPVERLLIYGTAGLAYGEVGTSGSVVGVQAPALSWNGSTSSTRAGWVVGGGLEYAVTNNLTIKGEYLYYDLGRTSVSALGNAAVRSVAALNGIDYVARTENRGSIVRAGANYKF
jgi:outer membrane immunogenic protein